MHVIVDLTMLPIGVEASFSQYITEVERVIEESGLRHELHSSGTNIEGEWDEVMDVIRRCHETLHALNVPRLFTDIQVSTRWDKAESLDSVVESVNEKLRV